MSGQQRWTMYVCSECGSLAERPTVTGQCRGFFGGPPHDGPPADQVEVEVVPASLLEERDRELAEWKQKYQGADLDAWGLAEAIDADNVDHEQELDALRSQLTEARVHMLKCAEKLRSFDNAEPLAVADELERLSRVGTVSTLSSLRDGGGQQT